MTKLVICVNDTPTLVGEPMFIHAGKVYEVEIEDSHPYDGIVKVLNPDAEEDLRLLNRDRAPAVRWPWKNRESGEREMEALLSRSAGPASPFLTQKQIEADPTVFHRHSPRYAAERFVDFADVD